MSSGFRRTIIAVLTIGLPLAFSLGSGPIVFLANAVIMALPQMAWILICKMRKSGSFALYGGLVTANLMLVYFIWSTSEGCGMEWLVYWPFMVIAIAVGGTIGGLVRWVKNRVQHAAAE